MRRTPWATWLWPGLPQLWVRGSWVALGVAVAAAGFLNLALLGTFGWSELLSSKVRMAVWGGLAAGWALAAIVSVVYARRLAADRQAGDEKGPFVGALEHYLQGNWFEAERTLTGLLRSNGRDLDARLMLATLLRHRGRLEEARGQLDLLGRLEGAETWQWEIRRERELLAMARRRSHPGIESAAGPTGADQAEDRKQAA